MDIKAVIEVKETIKFICPVCSKSYASKTQAENCASQLEQPFVAEVGDVIQTDCWDSDYRQDKYSIVQSRHYKDEAHKRQPYYHTEPLAGYKTLGEEDQFSYGDDVKPRITVVITNEKRLKNLKAITKVYESLPKSMDSSRPKWNQRSGQYEITVKK